MLARRTRIAIETRDRGLAAAEEAADADRQAAALGVGQVTREVEHYQAVVAAERASQDAGTDADADAIGHGARHRAGAHRRRQPLIPGLEMLADLVSSGAYPALIRDLSGAGPRSAHSPAIHRRPKLHSGMA